MYSDARAGWEGPMPNWPDLRLRVEAAAYRGRVVDFQMIAPWTRPARMPATAVAGPARWLEAIVTGLVMAVLFGALLVARHNWRKGRGDRRGALRLAATVLVVALGSWLLGATHVPILSTEIGRFFRREGLYTVVRWNYFFTNPPLSITEDELHEGFAIIDRLLPLTKKYFTRFKQCKGCGKIYWHGSHHEKMTNKLNMILDMTP